MNNKSLVSIIVINYNGEKYLRKCFDSLYAGTYQDVEIIFVDNGSADLSVEVVRNNFKQIKIIENKENLGLAVASNIGAQYANGEYLFFYNNDTIAEKFLVERLVDKMQYDSSIGICGCRTYTYDGKNIINEGVACDIFGYPYAKGNTFYVDAAIFIRKSLFDGLGGFDEKMFLYGEDRDICWRCWLYGYKVEVVKEAVFLHDSACITQDIKQYKTSVKKRFLGEFNALRAILKNYSMGFIFLILPLYIMINLAEILTFLMKGKIEVIREVYIKSYMENLRLFKDMVIKRKKVQRERVISDFGLIKHMAKTSGKFKLFLEMGVPEFNDKVKYSNA